MSSDERRESLADQAAAWVPPWQRETPGEREAPRESEAADEPEPVFDDGPVAIVEPEPGDLERALDPVNEVAEPAGDAGPESGDRESGLDLMDEVDEPETPPVAELVAVEPVEAEPAGVESVGSVAGPAELAAEPVEAEPVEAESVEAESVEAGLVEAESVEAGPVEAGLVEVEPVEAEPDGIPGGSEDFAGPDVAGVETEGAADPVEDGDGPESALALVDDTELRAALEAILMVVDEPVTELLLAQVLEQPTDRVSAALDALSASYTDVGRGFDLRRAAGGWRFYTRPEYARYVERFVLDGQQTRLTQAALETLAVVAYKQPVTRSRISAIRGVNCDGVIRTLVTRGLIEECGAEPDSGAYLYRTTTLFLEKLGLDSVTELPPLAPFLPDDVEAIADGQH